MNERARSARWSIAWLAVALAVAGCSSDGDDSGSDRSGSAPPPGSAGNASDGAGNGDDGPFGNPSNGVATDTSADGSVGAAGSTAPPQDLNAGNACGVGMLSAELTPVNMLVMFDRSQSMNDNDKWPNATAALVSFFENPSSAGLRIALRFFPHDEPAQGCTEDGCDAAACSQPLVSIAELTADAAPQDGHEGALIDAIDRAAPGDGNGQGTPIYAALDGSLRWAAADRAMHPEENTVVIFVTDGEPNGCDEDFDNISRLASDALAATSVSTYAIGLEGSNEDQMDQLAQAGGTRNGIFIDNSANAEQELLDALNAIRGETLTCDFAIPQPTDASMSIDLAKVNVTFTAGDGTAGTLTQVPDDAGCGDAKSWHYDDPQSPARIALCPAACELAQADPDGKLEILLGCETCGGLDVDCGNDRPPGLPPVL